jgi:hypothetical protein
MAFFPPPLRSRCDEKSSSSLPSVLTWARRQRVRLVLCEEPAAALGERLGAEKEAAMDEAYRRAYTAAGTRVTRGVRLVLVPEPDNPCSGAVVGGASVSPSAACR